MNNSESPVDLTKYFQPLEEDEIDFLKEETRFLSIVMYSSGIIIFTGISVFFILEGFKISDYPIYLIGLFLFFASYLILRSVFEDLYSKRKDLENGYKIVLEGKIENKREESDEYYSAYYFTVLHQEIMISFYYWERTYVGQSIVIHYAPECKYIFKIILQD